MDVERFEEIQAVLIQAVERGALEVLAARLSGELGISYKDVRELVTEADKRSDAAMREVFETQLPAIDSGIAIRLEESGGSISDGARWVGADPLDGTNHFACGGCSYSIQAHYIEDGVPCAGVVFQPEVYLPLAETPGCVGRLAYAIKGGGAFVRRAEQRDGAFVYTGKRRVKRPADPGTNRYVAAVPIGTKMSGAESERARNVWETGIVAVSTGVGCAGGNVMLTLFGGQQVYANLGAGEDLDLVPPQVIAEEAGMTVWGVDRRPPVWNSRKQPVVFAPTPEIAERFLQAAGL